jgi:hypothetical protein
VESGDIVYQGGLAAVVANIEAAEKNIEKMLEVINHSAKFRESLLILLVMIIQTSGPMIKIDGANTPIATFTAPSNMPSDIDLTFKMIV